MSEYSTTTESSFESIFNHVNEGILIANSKGEIIVVNPKCFQLFGYEPMELKGKKVEALIPQDYADRHVNHREAYMQNPTKRPMGRNITLYGLRKDGSKFPLEISLSYYDTSDGLFVIAFIIDITERYEQQENIRRINEELRVLNETLERKVNERTLVLKEALHDLEASRDELTQALEKEKELNEMKSRFISMASHEFRTPLSTVLSSVSLIAKYDESTEVEKKEKHIQRIKGAVNSLTEILNDFLSIGKLEEGKVNAHCEWVELNEFFVDLVAELQAISKNGQVIRLTQHGVNSFPTDKQLLRNILMNLLANAIKFSPEHTPITLLVDATEGELKLTVSDQGMGIPEEDQKHLFERFFRGKNVSTVQGTGLGLSIVAKYLELLNGSISFVSKPNEGTSFFVRIPANDVAL
jgi:PAS domain S-box-containing protein